MAAVGFSFPITIDARSSAIFEISGKELNKFKILALFFASYRTHVHNYSIRLRVRVEEMRSARLRAGSKTRVHVV